MDGQHAQLVDPALDPAPRLTRTKPPAATAARATMRLATGWAIALGGGWPLAYVLATALEPVPADPAAEPTALAALGWFAFMLALSTTIALAARRHPSAAIAGGVAGVIAVTMSVLCPVTGHHELGLWWSAQLALLTGMLALSLAALRASLAHPHLASSTPSDMRGRCARASAPANLWRS